MTYANTTQTPETVSLTARVQTRVLLVLEQLEFQLQSPCKASVILVVLHETVVCEV